MQRSTVVATGGFKGLGVAALGVGVGATSATVALKSSVTAALDAERAQTRLQSAMQSAGVSFRGYDRRIKDAIQSTSQLAALDDEDLSDAFAKILRTTGSVEKALEGMALAADIARARGIDLATAGTIVERANIGVLRGLRGVGVQIDAHTTKQQALARAQAQFGGAAEEFGKTNAAAAERFQVAVENLEEALGQGLLPVLTDTLNAFDDGAHQAKRFKDALDDIPGSGLFSISGADIVKKIVDTRPPPFKTAGDEAGIQFAEAFNFSAADQLRRGLRKIPLGLFAKDLIEQRGLGAPPPGPKPLTAEQRRSFFDTAIGRRINRVQDLRTLQAQVAELRKIEAEFRRKIAVTKDITRDQKLEDDLLDVQRQRRGVEAQIKSNQAAAKQLALDKERERIEKARLAAVEAREKAAAARERARLRDQRLQFRALGFGATGGELVPGLGALRRQFASVGDAVKGTFLDTGKTRSVMQQIRRVLSGGLGSVGDDVRLKVREILRDINQQLKDHETTTTKFRKANLNALLGGLGLSPDELRRLRARLSQVGPGGTVPGVGVGAFGVALPAVVVQHTTNLDGRVIEQSTSKHHQRRQRRNPVQKRGPSAGVAL